MTTIPEQGQQLPSVSFITEDERKFTSSDLRGQKTILYFYPKDDTPGCTKEACSFRDRMGDYQRAGLRVYGVSLDSPESHRKFREKYKLNFPLLTDEGGGEGFRGAGRPGGSEPRNLSARSCRASRESLPRRKPGKPRRRNP